jgi:hypothetical protein
MYYCDYCFTKKIENYEVLKSFFKCRNMAQYEEHITKPKCINARKRVEEMEESKKFNCEICLRDFTEDGYKNHLKNNKYLIKILDEDEYPKFCKDFKEYIEADINRGNLKCNQYILEYKGKVKRCDSLEDYVENLIKKIKKSRK